MFQRLFAALAILLALALPPAAPPAAAQDGGGFVGGVDDLPLMPGLVAQPDADVVFETPAGRIVEATALWAPGRAFTPDTVIAFYDLTLPQLGWEITGPGRYRREGETLHLDFPEDLQRAVRFRLAPAD